MARKDKGREKYANLSFIYLSILFIYLFYLSVSTGLVECHFSKNYLVNEIKCEEIHPSRCIIQHTYSI